MAEPSSADDNRTRRLDAKRPERLPLWACTLIALVVLACPARAGAEEPAGQCGPEPIALTRLTRWLDTTGATALLTDGAVVPEGARWPAEGVVFTSRGGSLTYDLGGERAVGALYFQGDGEADFTVLLSADAKTWRRVTLARVGAPGMRSRMSALERMPVRFVRVGEPSEPGATMTELRLFCELPPSPGVRVLGAPPAAPASPMTWSERLWLGMTGVPWLVAFQAAWLKLLIVGVGIALLLAGRFTRRFARSRAACLVILGIAGYSGYYNWGAYRFPDYTHGHELFHYVVGAKYFRELGYTRLYDCANAADAEDGFRRRLDSRRVRDLRTGGLIDAKTSLERAGECKESFSPSRWADFKEDVAFFRDHAEPERWDAVLRDNGFNPSPAWTMTGSLLANARPASRSFVGYADSMTEGVLALLDPVVVLLMFAAIAWAFGWRVVCVAAIVFGCNPLASFLWTGGSFLRQDWLASSVIGVCLLRKGHPASGGAALAYSALLRIFPGALLAPIALRMAWVGWRERRLGRVEVRVLGGAAVAALVVALASSATLGGARSWEQFARNTARLTSTPTENLVGLRTILSFRPSTRAALLRDDALADPYAPVREARRANFRRALPVYLLALGALLAGLVRAVRRIDEPWELACLGVAVVPIATEMSCYYSSLLLVAALLSRDRKGVALALLAACGALIGLSFVWGDESLYVCSSVVLVAFAGWMIWDLGSATESATEALLESSRASPWSARRLCLAAIAVGVALGGSLRFSDARMAKDRVCEERWTEFAEALRTRADLAPGSLEARRRATSLRVVGEDFADPEKMSAFGRAQADLRDALGGEAGGLEGRIARARERYDEAVADFDSALAKAPGAIDRATGRRFLARVRLDGTRL